MDYKEKDNCGCSVHTEVGSFSTPSDLYRYMVEEGIERVKGKITYWGAAIEFNHSIEEVKEWVEMKDEE
ncbi:hypothetical protein FHH43_01560 [Clostridium perfringens]|nr:hypothetical protein [Clostridium perfringens]QTZ82917.1 hypothetical protein phiCPD_00035 [Clostridium phage phiCp-D]